MGSYKDENFEFECTRCGQCCSPRWNGDQQWMPWSPDEQQRIADNVGMKLDEMREYLGFDRNQDGTWGNGFSLTSKPCGFRDPDPNEPGKYLCRCYQVQAINCGLFPACGAAGVLTAGQIESAKTRGQYAELRQMASENLARAAARCPGITVKDPVALALVPQRRAELLEWRKRGPYKPPLWRRIRRRVLTALGVQP